MLPFLSLYAALEQVDEQVLLHAFLVTLINLDVIFWLGTQLWLLYVLQRVAKVHREQRALNAQVQQNYERRLSVPGLIILFLANSGLVVGLKSNLDVFWLISELIIALALVFAVYISLPKQRPTYVNTLFSYANIVLSLVLAVVITIPAYASNSSNVRVSLLLVELLFLLAVVLVVGSILFMAVVYVPVLRHVSMTERVHALLAVLTAFSQLVIASTIITLLTAFLDALLHAFALENVLTSVYGWAFVFEMLLLGVLLFSYIALLSLLQPRLHKEYQKYAYTYRRLQGTRMLTGPTHVASTLSQQVKTREVRLTGRAQRVTATLQLSTVVGLGIVICMSLMAVFPVTSAIPTGGVQQQVTKTIGTTFVSTVTTTDKLFNVTLTINPNHYGPNVFTVRVVDKVTDVPSTNVHVVLSLVMLDMSMGTDVLNLQENGAGQFSGKGNLGMTGNWRIYIGIHTPDAGLHMAQVTFLTPY